MRGSRGGGPKHRSCLATRMMRDQPSTCPCEAPLACLGTAGQVKGGGEEGRLVHSCQSGGEVGGCPCNSSLGVNATRSRSPAPPVGEDVVCALRITKFSFRQRFRGPLGRLLFSAVLGCCLQGGRAQCSDSSLHPTLTNLSPQTLPWEGGTLTLTGGNFAASAVSSPAVQIDGKTCMHQIPQPSTLKPTP